jgi:hypothetical protein
MLIHRLTRRNALGLLSALPLLPRGTNVERGQAAGPRNPPADVSGEIAAFPEVLNRFALSGERNIMDEEHFGIANGRATVGVNYLDVASISGFFAPPYASSDFLLELRLFGEKVRTQKYTWYPSEVQQDGLVHGIAVSTSTVLAPGERGGAIEISLVNTGSQAALVPVQVNITGSLDYITVWDFARPATDKKRTTVAAQQRRITRLNGSGAFSVSTDLPFPRWEDWSSHWESEVRLAPGKKTRFYVSFAMGDRPGSEASADHILDAGEKVVAGAREKSARGADELRSKLPSLEASDLKLVRYFDRSLVPFLMNKWTVPEFVLNPYYSTGSVRGGCVACYLWDYGCIPEVLPLLDPRAVREHIKQFLRLDMTKHFLFNPMDGAAGGPWYPVNQEKIILSVYHYVLHTGDVNFLREVIGGKSILDWVVYQATFGDDFSKSAVLLDYGNGNNHLELRREYRYDNFMPDLNGRRYKSYKLAGELGKLVGVNLDYLNARAEPLKQLLKESLWSARDKWFYFQFANGTRELRYTVQMFKMIGSGVLDKEQEDGLVSHLNEQEFLSGYGLHSMSKKDPAFDQVDIDNGGGGNYQAFTPRIAEFLFNAGYTTQAGDLLQRTLWWGERMPYWGDSFVANQVEYRKDTPLQSDLSAPAAAQCIIFGLFGIKVLASGDVVVDPKPLKWSAQTALKGLQIRGTSIDISVDRSDYDVKVGTKTLRAKIGSAVRVHGGEVSAV